MTKRNTIAIAIALLLLAAAGSAPAQSTVTGALQGIVTRPGRGGAARRHGHDRLRRARLREEVDGDRRQGRLPLPVPPSSGIYAISAELSGFRPVQKDGVRVLARPVPRRGPDPLPRDRRRSGPRHRRGASVSVVDNAVSSNLTTEYLERQPLSRDVNSLVNQVPGVNSGRAYGSTEERTLAFNLDGVNVSNPASGEHWALTNPDWIKEIQVVGLAPRRNTAGSWEPRSTSSPSRAGTR